MAFKKKTWVDRISEYINRRRLDFEDGTSEVVSVIREEGTIVEEGDAFSAENMNDLEDRIESAITELNNGLANKMDKTTTKVFNIMPKKEDKYYVLPSTGVYLLLTTHNSSKGLNSISFYNAVNGVAQIFAGGGGFTWNHASDNRWLYMEGASGTPTVYFLKLQ